MQREESTAVRERTAKRGVDTMGIGVSLLLIAIGAILTWAVTATVSGVDLQTVGIILMVVGAAGGLISLVFWSSWGGFGGTRTESRTTTV